MVQFLERACDRDAGLMTPLCWRTHFPRGVVQRDLCHTYIRMPDDIGLAITDETQAPWGIPHHHLAS